MQIQVGLNVTKLQRIPAHHLTLFLSYYFESWVNLYVDISGTNVYVDVHEFTT